MDIKQLQPHTVTTVCMYTATRVWMHQLFQPISYSCCMRSIVLRISVTKWVLSLFGTYKSYEKSYKSMTGSIGCVLSVSPWFPFSTYVLRPCTGSHTLVICLVCFGCRVGSLLDPLVKWLDAASGLAFSPNRL